MCVCVFIGDTWLYAKLNLIKNKVNKSKSFFCCKHQLAEQLPHCDIKSNATARPTHTHMHIHTHTQTRPQPSILITAPLLWWRFGNEVLVINRFFFSFFWFLLFLILCTSLQGEGVTNRWLKSNHTDKLTPTFSFTLLKSGANRSKVAWFDKTLYHSSPLVTIFHYWSFVPSIWRCYTDSWCQHVCCWTS